MVCGENMTPVPASLNCLFVSSKIGFYYFLKAVNGLRPSQITLCMTDCLVIWIKVQSLLVIPVVQQGKATLFLSSKYLEFFSYVENILNCKFRAFLLIYLPWNVQETTSLHLCSCYFWYWLFPAIICAINSEFGVGICKIFNPFMSVLSFRAHFATSVQIFLLALWSARKQCSCSAVGLKYTEPWIRLASSTCTANPSALPLFLFLQPAP